MPNWCYNKIYMRDIENKDIFIENEHGDKIFDFNKIIPMPSELEETEAEIEVGNSEIYYYIGKTLLKLGFVDIGISGDFYIPIRDIVTKMENNIKNGVYYTFITSTDTDGNSDIQINTLSEDEVFNIGKKKFELLSKYGASNWYDWCIMNWGTKWGMQYTNNNQDTNDGECSFITAWSPPIPAIQELSRQNPYDEITHFYLDEFCCFGGYTKYLDGEIIEENICNQDSDFIYCSSEIGVGLKNFESEDSENGKLTAPAFLKPAFGRIDYDQDY